MIFSISIFSSYQPAHDDELDLAIDQVIDFLGEVEDGWWKGRSQQTGKVRLLHCHIVSKHHDMICIFWLSLWIHSNFDLLIFSDWRFSFKFRRNVC